MIDHAKDPTLETLARQEAYKARGLYDGPLDNWDGVNTQAAAKAFRLLHELASPATAPKPGARRKVSKDGVDLIKEFESCLKPTSDGRFAAYPDPGYGWRYGTIGWGTVQYPDGTQVKQGDVITQAQADEYLEWEINEKAAGVLALLEVPVNDDQFGALVAFAYNVGLGSKSDATKAGLADSTLLRLVNAGNPLAAAEEFGKYIKSNGRVFRGLVRRRASERNLFLGRRPFIIP